MYNENASIDSEERIKILKDELLSCNNKCIALENEIEHTKLTESTKVAELQARFIEKNKELENQLAQYKKHLSNYESEASKIDRELNNTRYLCRMAHDRIVELTQENQKLQTKLIQLERKNKEQINIIKDLNWKLEQVSSALHKFENSSVNAVNTDCVCEILREKCGEAGLIPLINTAIRISEKVIIESGTQTENIRVDKCV